ncbi:MAG TPA: MBL fold metallo-hydrolase [Terracidiphilus sp.]|jgi:glyoxylase-like metal-dependent hydrolase (beta-lactamase superfamily II)
MTRLTSLLLAVSLTAPLAWPQFPQPDGGDLERGVLPAKWTTGGPKCMEIPEWQVHEYNPNLYILRQSGCTDAEMPFLYLFFGKERGLLWDTGSRNGNLAPTLQRVVHDWLERNHRERITLIVTHSHSHGDHVFGDPAIKALNDPAIQIQFVAPTVEAASSSFGITAWPTAPGQADLGGRVLNIVPIPGHDDYAIALYDRLTGIVLTGDNLYPGRLYVKDFAVYKASTERLIAFLNGKPVAHILGNHIEQTQTPFKDFPIGSIYHPGEHCLELTFGTLLELEDGLQSMSRAPRRLATRDFTIWPVDPKEKGLGPQMEEIFKRTQEEQLPNKWNQPAH